VQPPPSGADPDASGDGSSPRLPAPDRAQLVTGGAAVACYAVGYPLGIVGGSGVGWVLVSLGGFFLLGCGALTVRRIHRGGSGR
jgi:hypothetical protein